MKSHTARPAAWAAIGLLGLVAGCAPPRHRTTVVERQAPAVETKTVETTTTTKVNGKIVDRYVASWPTASHGAADQMIAKYGPPDEATPSMLVWYNNGDWKRTIVHRDVYDHNFPQPHQDVLEQVIDYRVPPESLADLDRFDGSLSVNRTRGELTSWAQSEDENRRAIDRADDIIHDRLAVDEARQSMARSAALTTSGKSVESKPGWNWKRSVGSPADPDSAVEPSESLPSTP